MTNPTAQATYQSYPPLTPPSQQPPQTLCSAWKSALAVSYSWTVNRFSYKKFLSLFGIPIGAALFYFAFEERDFGPYLFTVSMGALVGKLVPEALLPICIAFGVIKYRQSR